MAKFKILVVEDEKDAREIFIDILTSAGYDVVGATQGEEALEKLQQDKFDLVYLDIIMPIRDGIQTLAEIKKFAGKYGDMKIIMLTNIGGDLAIEKALKLGADGYLLKSETEPNNLVSVTQKYLPLAA